MKLKKGLSTEDGWVLKEDSVDVGELVDSGSRFMVGNGYLGYRGTCCDWSAEQYVACIVTNTWDKAEGAVLTELCNLPNPLHTYLRSEGKRLDSLETDGNKVQTSRSINLRNGLFTRSTHFMEKGVVFTEERFALPDPVHGIVARYQITAEEKREFSFYTGIDTNVWSLSGEHFRTQKMFQEGSMLGIRCATQEKSTKVYIIESMSTGGIEAETSVEYHSHMLLRKVKFTLEAGETATFEKFATIYSTKDIDTPKKSALGLNLELQAQGYEELAANAAKFWEKKWDAFDIQIEGNLEDQIITRFNTFESFIATPLHQPLPVGARGLSCQVYQGASFWDQEIFNLPMYMYTYPEIARTLLQYRYNTLDGARSKAERLGYKGAFFAWASGETGDELFPDFFFSDMFSGRPFRNYFNTWQIHVSPDIAFAVDKYLSLTDDRDFLTKYGAELLFEIARFVVSRVTYRYDRDRNEILRVIGPDEYHENVDNNAFTNFMSANTLRYAVKYYKLLQAEHEEALHQLADKIDLDEAECELWEHIGDSLFVPEPDPKTGLIEQFEGYFQLEDTTPETLRTRLLDPGEYWGYPVGVAVHTQVLKQADVIQLLALYNDFPHEVYQANYDYYERRTEHGSSLSPAMHAIVASRADKMHEAYRYFIEGATIDFYGKSRKKKSGGKFLGGIHTAAAGAVWLIVVEGFAGVSVRDDVLHMNPKLPSAWEAYTFGLNLKGQKLSITVRPGLVEITSSEGIRTITAEMGGQTIQIAPGGSVSIDTTGMKIAQCG